MRRRITCLDLIMLLLSALVSCALLACSTSYDAQTDAMLMQLHGKTVAFLLHIFYTGDVLATTYPERLPFYEQAETDLAALTMRTEALGVNTRTAEELVILRNLYIDLQKHDLEQGLSAVYARALVPVFGKVFRALLTLEVGKKPRIIGP